MHACKQDGNRVVVAPRVSSVSPGSWGCLASPHFPFSKWGQVAAHVPYMCHVAHTAVCVHTAHAVLAVQQASWLRLHFLSVGCHWAERMYSKPLQQSTTSIRRHLQAGLQFYLLCLVPFCAEFVITGSGSLLFFVVHVSSNCCQWATSGCCKSTMVNAEPTQLGSDHHDYRSTGSQTPHVIPDLLVQETVVSDLPSGTGVLLPWVWSGCATISVAISTTYKALTSHYAGVCSALLVPEKVV